MRRRTTVRVSGWVLAGLVLTGCATTTAGRPTAVTTGPATASTGTTTGTTTDEPRSSPTSPPETTGPSGSTSTDGTAPSADGTAPSADGTAPSADGTATSTDGTAPSADGTPPDLSGGLTGTITWNTGSVPPPYNYTWTAEFTATSGTFTLHTNYATDEQSWSQDFSVTAESMATLTAALAAAGVGAEGPPSDEHLVGGPTGSYRLTTVDGTGLHATLGDSSATSTELGRISDAVEAFVGPAAWNTAMDSYQEWASKQHS